MNYEGSITLTSRWKCRTFMQDVGTRLAVVMVRIAEDFILNLHNSDSYKCYKLDIVSCIHLLTYSCNIVQGVALTISALEEKWL
jgi:hypothetical protein